MRTEMGVLNHKLQVIQIALTAFEPFNGKQISKRLATAFEAELAKRDFTDFIVYYDKEHRRISVWNNSFDYMSYNKRLELRLGLDETFSIVTFEESVEHFDNALCEMCELWRERVKTIEKLDKLDKLNAEREALLSSLGNAKYYIP